MKRLRRLRGRARRRAARGWWVRHPLELIALENGLHAEYQGFGRRVVGRALVYNGEVDVGDAGTRRVALIFSERPALRAPMVMVDGPRRSRHRYRWARPTSLCMWYPPDRPPWRWTLEEGLVGLIDRTRVHLLKEAWWRVTGRWDSPEVHREVRGSEQRRSLASRKVIQRQRCWCGSRPYSACHGQGDESDELLALGLV